jgi:ribonucleoside-diphosphate reductase alpha chain
MGAAIDYHPFVGMDSERVGQLETKLKERYELSEHNFDGPGEYRFGYKIVDRKTGNESFLVPNSRLVLETRYLEKGESRELRETPLDLFARVAVNIADADLKYNPTADVEVIAEEFLEDLVYQRFIPNTPTLCNAGRSLQQLSACFVIPVEDYLATDDIGEDPEKQGHGIYDALRYMAMVHKSGGGTGFNFSHLRPRSDRISTTFGSSSGPVSFIKVFDASTNAVNQGGFRRGANMGILNYTHPDIFEFVGEKANNHTLTNFNLSVGVDAKYIEAVRSDGYFRLINPKGEKSLPESKRVWRKENLLSVNDPEYSKLKSELDPSLIIDKDDKTVVRTSDGVAVGKIDSNGDILIRARSLEDYVAQCAWTDGCPGVIFLDRIQQNNTVSHIEKIEATNPCGEQPLPPFGACDLGAVNLTTCVREKKIDYEELDTRVIHGVHFLDNVIDKSKFPFQKVYNAVHSTRRIGLGIMGWSEMLTQLGVAYGSNRSVELARELSSYITNKAREASIKLAEERGVFPVWKGSVFDSRGQRVRNATATTIAPNGTTGMIYNVTGGIEPYFSLAFTKTCMDGKVLVYRNPLLDGELKLIFDDSQREDIWKRIEGDHGRIKDIKEIPDEMKNRYLTSHEITPEMHVRMQAAFQSGIDNAVSKTVNLPNEASVDDVKRIYQMAYDEGCVGITVFRDGSKTGVLSGIEKKVVLEQHNVKLPAVVDKKPQAIKYRVKRIQNGDSLHIILTSDLYVDDKSNRAFFLPTEDFQIRAPLGHATSVSFAQSGMDRTEILRGPDPDYAELIARLQSASSNEEEGLGRSMKIKSIEHAVGLVLEDYLLRNGVVTHDPITKKLVNVVRKPQLRRVEIDSEEYAQILTQVRISSDEEIEVIGNHGKLGHRFVCEDCGAEEYTFEAGCNHPKCLKCGAIEGGGCG